jgi:hypothetical protein
MRRTSTDLTRPSHERLDRRSRVPAVPVRPDDGEANLSRPHVVDERATDLTHHEIVFRTQPMLH